MKRVTGIRNKILLVSYSLDSQAKLLYTTIRTSQDNLSFTPSTELTMQIGHCHEFQALTLRQNKLRNCGLRVC